MTIENVKSLINTIHFVSESSTNLVKALGMDPRSADTNVFDHIEGNLERVISSCFECDEYSASVYGEDTLTNDILHMSTDEFIDKWEHRLKV